MTESTQNPIRFFLFSTLTAVLLCFVCIVGWNALAAESKSNPHELVGLLIDKTCEDCHRQAPATIPKRKTRSVLPKPDDFVVDAVAMCITCHSEDEQTHPLGGRPEYPVPADLPLDKKGGISCLTCHYVHGSLKSDHPCCSSSFLDRMLNRKRLTKSFLLRRDNVKGELCKACHESSSRKKEKK